MLERAVVPFDAEGWRDEAPGVRALVRDVEGTRWAVVEYAPGAGRPEWCAVGHRGYVVSGEIEYEFGEQSELLRIRPAGARADVIDFTAERARRSAPVEALAAPELDLEPWEDELNEFEEVWS